MLTRYRHEITLTSPNPTARACLLSLYEDSRDDIRVPVFDPMHLRVWIEFLVGWDPMYVGATLHREAYE